MRKFCVLVFMQLGHSFISYESARPDEQCIGFRVVFDENYIVIATSIRKVV